MSTMKSKYGPWALVTGASSGIGREFSNQLAANGLNIALAARRKNALELLAKELKTEHQVETRVIESDLSQPGSAKTLAEATAGLEVGLLVNNAGVEIHGEFVENDGSQTVSMLQLNVTTPMELSQIFGKQMKSRRRGGILLVASTLGFQPTPFFANYAATKAYILSLGEALHYELKPHGVDVTVLAPGLTDTSMYREMEGMDWSKMPIKTMPAEPVVKVALSGLGKRPAVIPGGMNNVMTFMGTRLMSRKQITTMFGGMMRKAMS